MIAPSPTVERTSERTLTPASTPLPATATIRPVKSPTDPAPVHEGTVVSIGGADFPVELALTSDEQIQGLSGRPVLKENTGMLFVYERQSKYSFWMPDMRFPLDIVWIGADCTVADVTLNALPPEPGQANQDLPLYSPKSPAQYVLEVYAGEADEKGIKEGVGVEFLAELAGEYGC